MIRTAAILVFKIDVSVGVVKRTLKTVKEEKAPHRPRGRTLTKDFSEVEKKKSCSEFSSFLRCDDDLGCKLC